MKHLLLLNLSLLALTCASVNVYAQAVESVPLAPMEIKPIEARPLDGVPQEDTAAPLDSAPLVQPETYQSAPPIPPMMPYGARMGTVAPERLPENKMFCALKITLAKANTKTDGQIKTYLDSNADKITYKQGPSGKSGHAYCLDITERNARGKIYTALKKIVRESNPDVAAVNMAGTGFAPVTNRKDKANLAR